MGWGYLVLRLSQKCNFPQLLNNRFDEGGATDKIRIINMFKEKKIGPMSHSSSNETIIAQGVRVEGEFRSQGDVVIDGEVAGSVETQSTLQVGETAKIHADVKAVSAVIAGEVQGNIFVKEMLELLSTSRVKGDIVTGQISVAAGAQINGTISMGEGTTNGRGRKDPEMDEEEMSDEG